MKIEKITENKIRIILSLSDLEEEHIDLHSFMSNSAESQALFCSLLSKAMPLRCLYPSESLSQRAQQHTNQKQDIIFHHLILKMDIFQQIFSVII